MPICHYIIVRTHQVLDSSREDWWLVLPMAVTGDEASSEYTKEGWVPANHLEKLP